MATPKHNIPAADWKAELTPGKQAEAIKAAAAAKLGELIRVPVAAIKIIPGYNVRITDTADYRAGINELQQSIEQNGFYADKPLGVYVGKEGDENVLYLRSGHRRLEAVNQHNFEAAAEAKIETVPAVIVPAATTMEEHLVELVQGNAGKDLTPFEKGLVVKRLIGFGMDKKTIASKLGFTPRYIDDLLVIVGAPAAARTLILNNQVSSTQALRELRKDPAKAAAALTALVKAATEKGKTKGTAGAAKPKMARTNVEVNFGVGDVMGEVLKALASQIRATVPHDTGEGDKVSSDGKLTLVISLPVVEAPKAAPKAKAAPKTPAAAKPAKGAAAAKTAAAAKAAGLVPGTETPTPAPAPTGDEPDPLAHALGEPATPAPAPADAGDGLADL